jgi:uncharacterized protein (TIGR03435 family)
MLASLFRFARQVESLASERFAIFDATANAMPDELGLKLSPTKAPVEIFVIDHVEKPSSN